MGLKFSEVWLNAWDVNTTGHYKINLKGQTKWRVKVKIVNFIKPYFTLKYTRRKLVACNTSYE